MTPARAKKESMDSVRAKRKDTSSVRATGTLAAIAMKKTQWSNP